MIPIYILIKKSTGEIVRHAFSEEDLINHAGFYWHHENYTIEKKYIKLYDNQYQ